MPNAHSENKTIKAIMSTKYKAIPARNAQR